MIFMHIAFFIYSVYIFIMTEISDHQAQVLIKEKDIPEEIKNSGEKVAVVLTQDWCPQWLFMKSWLGKMKDHGIAVYHLPYNKKPYFREFMTVKEDEFNNDLVPYVRYYINGRYIKDSNFVSKELFLSNFQG